MSDWFEAERHVERAHELYEAGRWAEAEAALREALSLNPYRAEWHFNLGLTLEAAGRWCDAAAAFKEASTLEPRDYQTQLLLGVNLLRMEDPVGAMGVFDRARQIDPTRAEPFVYLVEAHARRGDHEQAELMFYQALQLEPAPADQALAYANLAESLIEREQWERAIHCLREASALNPQLERVHARLAHTYARTGRHERARQLYLRELRDQPGDIDTLLDLGCLLVDMNRLAEAAEKFRRVLEIESDNPDAHYYLGGVALRQRRLKEAAAAWRLVLRLDPEYPEVRRRLARLMLDENNVPEARKLLRREMNEVKRDAGLFEEADLLDLAVLLLDAKLSKDSAVVHRMYLDRCPADARGWHHLSLAYFQMGNRGLGAEACAKALELDPNLQPALHNMALACIQDRNFRRARIYLERAIALAPDDHALRRLRMTIRLYRMIEFLGQAAGRLWGGSKPARTVD